MNTHETDTLVLIVTARRVMMYKSDDSWKFMFGIEVRKRHKVKSETKKEMLKRNYMKQACFKYFLVPQPLR